MRTWGDWHAIHQPSEIRYWRDIGLEHLRDEGGFKSWWETIFDFVEPQGKCLDVGCGPRPPFGRGSTAIDPLIYAYKEFTPPEWWNGVKTFSERAEDQQSIGKFDTVMCWNCIDHTIGWKDILANLAFYVKKVGRVALSTDFNPPADGHPGFDREEFFAELDKHFEVTKYADDFQDRAVALVLKCA